MKAMQQDFTKVPKVREFAEIVLSNGEVLAGYVFVDATARIQDLLNGETSFFAFIDREERIHLVNKHAIVEVRPFDQ
jgi:sRNA-binding regulator protein Hfq